MINPVQEYIRLRPNNPSRPVDWMWRRAVLLNEGQFKDGATKLPKDDYLLLNKVRAFVKSLNTNNTPNTLIARFEDIYEVYFINQHTDSTKWALEAYVVAGLTPEEIAEKIGYGKESAAIVSLYEKIFFDCRDRLAQPHFVLDHLLGIKASGRLIATEDRLWKLFAWAGSRSDMGTTLLEGYMSLDNMPEAVRRWYDGFIESQMSRKTINAILKHDAIYNPELIEMVKLHHDTRKLNVDIQQKVGEIDDNAIHKAKKQLVDSISLAVVDLNKTVDSAIELPKGLNVDVKEAEAAVDKVVNQKLIENKKTDK